MKILTLNTWQKRGPWEDRWNVILDGLIRLGPDLAGFQEVFDPDWGREVRRRSGYPYLVFPPEHSGLMFLSRFPVTESFCLTMKTGAPTEDYARYALFMRVDVKGKSLSLFNTHLSWRPDEGGIREKQVGELLDFIGEKSGRDEAVVMGDFNAPPGATEIRKMVDPGGFTDAYASLFPEDPGITWDNRNPYVQTASVVLPDRRIDYLFFRGAGHSLKKLKSVGRVFLEPDEKGIYASDHAGLLADFEEGRVSG